MLAADEHPAVEGGRERAFSEKLSDRHTEIYEG